LFYGFIAAILNQQTPKTEQLKSNQKIEKKIKQEYRIFKQCYQGRKWQCFRI